MEPDEIRRKSSDFQIGEPLDLLSVDELAERINCLEGEIARIRLAMEKKQGALAAAAQLFRQ